MFLSLTYCTYIYIFTYQSINKLFITHHTDKLFITHHTDLLILLPSYPRHSAQTGGQKGRTLYSHCSNCNNCNNCNYCNYCNNCMMDCKHAPPSLR